MHLRIRQKNSNSKALQIRANYSRFTVGPYTCIWKYSLSLSSSSSYSFITNTESSCQSTMAFMSSTSICGAPSTRYQFWPSIQTAPQTNIMVAVWNRRFQLPLLTLHNNPHEWFLPVILSIVLLVIFLRQSWSGPSGQEGWLSLQPLRQDNWKRLEKIGIKVLTAPYRR